MHLPGSRLLAACFVPLVLACGGKGTGPSPAPSPRPNVLLITIDTLRADRLGRGFTPTLDSLAAGGLTFTQARTPVPLTLPAHATILSGLLPHRHGVRENGTSRFAGHPTLATILAQRHYLTGAAVGAFVLARQFGLDAGFAVYDDSVVRTPGTSTTLEAERGAAAVTHAAATLETRVLQQRIERPGRPGTTEGFFFWVHYYDPHAPYGPPADYLRWTGSSYDGEIAYVDAEVRRLLFGHLRLHQKKPGQDTLVIVAGDHGESLGEHGERTHGMLLYDGALRVPLIFAVIRGGSGAHLEAKDVMQPVLPPGLVAGPPGGGGRRADPVSLADVAPTILAALGIEAPGGLDGVNLLKPPVRDREIYAETQYPRVAGWSPLTALIADGRKFVRGGRTQLFDLATDPAESRDLAAERATLAAAMETRLQGMSAAARPAKNVLTVETRERLRSLGYVAASPAAAAPGGAPDPADRIAEWTAFEAVSSDLVTARRAPAIARLRQLAARNPDAQAFHTTLARVLGEDGRHREALAAYRRAVARWPEDPVLLHDLAVAARAAGEAGEAMRAEQAAIAIRPDDPAALNGIGLLHVDAGRLAEAAAAFERAATTQSDPSYHANLGNARRAMGDVEGARAAYQAALAVDGSWPDAANGLGVVLVQQGQAADAVPWFERALARSPDFVEARLNLGIAAQEAGRLEYARINYRTVLAGGPGHAREKAAARDLLRQLDARGRGDSR